MAVERTNLKKIRLSELNMESKNVMIVGIIIAKEQPYYCTNDESSNSENAFWNFVLRDSPFYYANVLCFGHKTALLELNDKYKIGDVVSIMSPQVEMGQRFDSAQEFCRIVITRYTLVLNDELYRRVVKYEGNHVPYLDLMRFVTKPVSGAATIAEIQNFKHKQNGIDVFGCVKFIGKVQERATLDGIKQVREIIIIDQTSSALRVIFCDIGLIARVEAWKLGITVLFITNVCCEWSDYTGSMVAKLTSRSIITEDPIAPETSIIKDHMSRMNPSALVDSRALFDNDLSSIKNVMTVQDVLNKADTIMAEMETAIVEHEFTAVVTALITELDFHGLSRLITLECSRCSAVLGSSSTVVANNKCTGSEQEHSNVIITFDIRLVLTDQTGSMFNCRLFGQTAEEVLNCSVEQYLEMNDEQKSLIESKLLMQVRKFYIHVVAVGLRNATISILNSILATPTETKKLYSE